MVRAATFSELPALIAFVQNLKTYPMVPSTKLQMTNTLHRIALLDPNVARAIAPPGFPIPGLPGSSGLVVPEPPGPTTGIMGAVDAVPGGKTTVFVGAAILLIVLIAVAT